jgi:hypothetical protein
MNEHIPPHTDGALEFSQAETLRNLPHPETAAEVPLPAEGGIYEKNGTQYRFVRMPTGRQVWNDNTQQMEPEYHTLRTWFSHSTPGVTDGGPGWDARWGLLELSKEDMLRRYGHEFTRDEVTAPAGRRQNNDPWGEEDMVGGMPDNIPYYGLEKIENDTPH